MILEEERLREIHGLQVFAGDGICARKSVNDSIVILERRKRVSLLCDL